MILFEIVMVVLPRVEIILFHIFAVVVSYVGNPESLVVKHDHLHRKVVQASRPVLVAFTVLHHGLLKSK